MWKFDESRIALARESRSLTQGELATVTGLSQQQISQWEKGEVRPGQDSLTKICNALNIEPRFFFVRSGTIGNVTLPVE